MKAFLNIPIKEFVFVDANNNAILYNYSGIHQESVPATGNTLYYGVQSFMVDSISANSYKLIDDTRGDGIVTIDGSQQYDENLAYSYPLFESDSKSWDLSEIRRGNAALDAHYSATQYYDFLKNKFDRNSIDNYGFPLISIVHIQAPFFVNAYWDGHSTNYGDGDCIDYGPLTSLEIVGHEFTHGLTNFTSQLIYKDESGAINEAMSDIFGKALEKSIIDPDSFTWRIGEAILSNDDAEPIRDMKDPNLHDDPKYYKGEMWEDGANVHVNSGVFNHWFYLVVEGASGTNEKNYHYNVQSIGLDKALDIVYGVETGYLTESSGYVDLYQSTVAYTKDLFGDDSPELESVIEAWKTIGLDDNTSVSSMSIKFTNLGDSFFHTLCEDDSEYTIEYDITNNGNTPMDAGTKFNIDFTIFENTVGHREIVLEEPLMSGSSLSFADQLDFTNAPSFFILKANLSYGDNEVKNQFFFQSFTADKDLSISYDNITDDLCASIKNQVLYVFIQNESCSAVESGETAKLIFKNEKGEYSQDITFNNGIFPGDYEYIDLNLQNIPDDFGLFDVILKYDGDVDLQNNSLGENIVGKTHQITKPTTFDFSDTSLDTYLQIGQSYGMNAQVVDYKDNPTLGYQGVSKYSIGLECEDPADFFISQRFVAMDFCVSMVNFDQPALKFDLTTIINKTFSEYNIPDNYYAMVKVMLDDKEFPIIYNQENRKTISHEFELPKNYEGGVKIAIYVLGTNNQNVSDVFKLNNWILFDNIKFFDKKDVATNDIDKNTFNIYPNPATNMLTIIPKDRNTNYEIKFFDILGQEIGRKHFIGDLHYDVSRFNSGSILYQIIENGHINTVGKVAIVR